MSLSQLISFGNSSAALLNNIIKSKLGSLFKPNPNQEYPLPSILSYSGCLILVCTAYKLYEKYYEGKEDKLELAGTTVFDSHTADWAMEQKVPYGQNDMSSDQSTAGGKEHAGEEADEDENEEDLDEELGDELGDYYEEQYGETYGGEYGEMVDQPYGEDYGGEYGDEYDEEYVEDYNDEGDEEFNDDTLSDGDDEGVIHQDDEWVYPEDQH
ncbi:hypothetical protein AK88_03563 [Plasmodium fragile]|uniref:Uncharacterized protein n=1 Tax=Plasmodium fragile TaxID=5857 RepID=A0A0D9QI95_PLAFR|nr:uncharacterized protein AK88_03563 [Plasmodium fragile]KJP86749.1 hypothetical protein AK88_03563 [Plasmodium fragile]